MSHLYFKLSYQIEKKCANSLWKEGQWCKGINVCLQAELTPLSVDKEIGAIFAY